MMTRALPAEAGAGALVLSSDKKRLRLTARHAPDARWQVVDASEPRNEWDSPNKGCKLIVCDQLVPAGGSLSFVITFEPLASGD